jgi:hypothetical protein
MREDWAIAGFLEKREAPFFLTDPLETSVPAKVTLSVLDLFL